MMAKAVQENYALYDGFIICHGTDTLAQIGAVDAAQSQRLRNAQVVQLRQMGQQFFTGKHRLQALLGAHAGNGAARGDKKQTLFGHKMQPSMAENQIRIQYNTLFFT